MMSSVKDTFARLRAVESQAREQLRGNLNFPDAVAQVRDHAARGDLAALEAVLRDSSAERAPRLVAANTLADAGVGGMEWLWASFVAMRDDPQGQVFALQGAARVRGATLDTLLLRASHSPHQKVRRAARRLLGRLSPPAEPVFRLRCYLPEPLCYASDLEARLPILLAARDNPLWSDIVCAIGYARYLPAVRPLVAQMAEGTSRDQWVIAPALARIGPAAVPVILEALPSTLTPYAAALAFALQQIGDERALEPLEALQRRLPPPPFNNAATAPDAYERMLLSRAVSYLQYKSKRPPIKPV